MTKLLSLVLMTLLIGCTTTHNQELNGTYRRANGSDFEKNHNMMQKIKISDNQVSWKNGDVDFIFSTSVQSINNKNSLILREKNQNVYLILSKANNEIELVDYELYFDKDFPKEYLTYFNFTKE